MRKDMCGLVGIVCAETTHPIAKELYVGLLHLEHRGKESAGAATYNKGNTHFAGGYGRISERHHFLSIQTLPGSVGIGHTRYGTTGKGIQPIKGTYNGRDFYIAHNGNLVNTDSLRRITKSPRNASDTQVIAHLISQLKRDTIEDTLLEVVPLLKGAFCLLILFEDKIFAIKDAYGFHPLQIGECERGMVVASESSVFDHIGARFICDIPPGHIVTLSRDDWHAERWARETDLRFDIFEYIYFLRPESVVHSVEAGKARENMGYRLAFEHPTEADIIMSIPDSGNHAAEGYVKGVLRQGYTGDFSLFGIGRPHGGRSFIEPAEETREWILKKLKMNPRRSLIRGRHVMLVDDSLVRGKTISVLQRFFRERGAKKVSLVLASPAYRHHCFYGIDTYRIQRELAAHKYGETTEDIRRGCGLDTLGFLSLGATKEAVLRASHAPEKRGVLTMESFYDGPFTGIYPAGLGDYEKNVEESVLFSR